jgi:FAD/FMN-containing dehydrogenase
VIATSTHGSGMSLPAFPDYARSLDIVAADARVHRVERADGPTDPEAFAREHPEWELHQDDVTFDAAVVGIGCIGVVYAATLVVTEAYWLTEVRELSTWSRVRGQLPKAIAANRHYEVYINPYAGDDGEHRCITCRRNPADPRKRRTLDRLRRHWWIELLSRLKIIGLIGLLIDRASPDDAPGRIDQQLSILADNEYSGPSYKVLNIGAANLLPAYSSEIAVPFDLHREAVETLVATADRHRRLGRNYHTGLISLRFVAASSAHLSMMQGRDTMTIELILMNGTEGGLELLAAHEEALHALGGRPHWGQINWLTDETVRELYPRYDDWLAVRARFDPEGLFDAPLTRRLALPAAAR